MVSLLFLRLQPLVPITHAKAKTNVNVQCPVLELTETARESYLKQCPLGRLGTPDEVADAAMFLITNRFANNCVLNLDGGLSAN
jgi:NAD(P)-dependent dehydrogenase (short-subunit alcohol dehydrogenase family)